MSVNGPAENIRPCAIWRSCCHPVMGAVAVGALTAISRPDLLNEVKDELAAERPSSLRDALDKIAFTYKAADGQDNKDSGGTSHEATDQRR